MIHSQVNITELKEKFFRAPVDTSDGIRYLYYSLILQVIVSAISILTVAVILLSSGVVYNIPGLGCISGFLSLLWIIFIILGAMRVRKGAGEVKINRHDRNSLLGMIFSILVIGMLLVSIIYPIVAIFGAVFSMVSKQQTGEEISSEDMKKFMNEMVQVIIVTLILSSVTSIFIGFTYFFPIRSFVKNSLPLLLALILIIAAAVAGSIVGIVVVQSTFKEIIENMPATTNNTTIENYLNNVSANITGLQGITALPTSLSFAGFLIFMVLYGRVRRELEEAVKILKSEEKVPPPIPPPPGVEIYSPKSEDDGLTKVKCPFCDFEFEIAPSLIGKEVQCPRCGAKFKT